jgi:Plant transposon protein
MKKRPMAWHGQLKGKENAPSIVLEAFADYNFWIWHCAFGYAGTLNDINNWEQSPLLKSCLDGCFLQFVDFEFDV